MPKRLSCSWLPQSWQAILKQQPSHTIAATAALTLGLFIPQVVMNWRTYQDFQRFRQQELRLQHLSDRATHLDEVLTMSALMNAATGDRTWEQRYKQYVPELDKVIQESMHLVPSVYKSQDAKQVDLANQALIALEEKAFQLVQKNRKKEALQLLSSADYQTQKRIYAAGVAQRNLEIQQQLQVQAAHYQSSLKWSGITMVFSILLLIPAWWIVLQLLQSYLRDRAAAEIELQQKNQDLTGALSKLQEAQRTIQTEKLSSLGQMVAGIAHEFNNPVSFIQGNLPYVEEYSKALLQIIDLYQQHVKNPPAIIQEHLAEVDFEFFNRDLPRLLQSMKVGTQRIEAIVIGLRTFSHLDESDCKTVNIHAGLDSALLLLQHSLQQIELVKHYGDLPEIECSPRLLNQVFHAILLNAIEAIKSANPVEPRIEIKTNLVENKWMRIAIADNGLGISPAIQQKIFDPFFTTKPIGQGKGLGLSMSYQIVTEHHQGKLYCVSVPNQGTEFFIEIPVHS